MGRDKWWLALLGAAVVCLSVASGASAQDARALFQQGQAAYQAGEYESAIEAWERAYAMDPRPALQYNLAQAYGRLARVEEESASLRLYIAGALAAGTASDDSQIVSARARLSAIADRIRRTGIQLTGVPSGAHVLVDGTPNMAGNGEAIPLSPGPHRIEVQAEGYEEFNSSVVIRAGETLVLPVMLDERREVAGSSSDSGMSGGRLGAVLCWSVGGASLLVGSVLGGVALSKSDGAVDGTTQAESARGMALGSDITIATGAALGVTGLVLFLVSDDGEEAPAIAVAPLAAPRTAGLQVFGRF